MTSEKFKGDLAAEGCGPGCFAGGCISCHQKRELQNFVSQEKGKIKKREGFQPIGKVSFCRSMLCEEVMRADLVNACQVSFCPTFLVSGMDHPRFEVERLKQRFEEVMSKNMNYLLRGER